MYSSYFENQSSRINLVSSVDDSTYDTVITDYSSMVFDFVYLKRKIIYFIPDLEVFWSGLNGYRKTDLPLDKAFGPLCKMPDEALKFLRMSMDPNCPWPEEYLNRMDNFFLRYDSNQRERLYEQLRFVLNGDQTIEDK